MRNKAWVRNWFFAGAVFFQISNAQAQLADGSTAPDFVLTDINGNTHHLYDYLEDGKTVIIDFFAAHCPTCWAYHNTHAVRDFYDTHGPSGSSSQDAVVIAIEFDAGNGNNELYGISGVTQGDWVTGTPYPIVNPEGADRDSVLGNYNVWFYPMVYRICPDKKVLYVGTPSAEDLASHLDYCTAMSVRPVQMDSEEIYLDYALGRLYFTGLETSAEYRITLYDISGKPVWTLNPVSDGSVLLGQQLPGGTYIYSFSKNGMACRRGKLILR